MDGIMAECVTMTERLVEVLLGDVPEEAAPAVEVEVTLRRTPRRTLLRI